MTHGFDQDGSKRSQAGTARFGKALEALIWIAALAVLAENFLLRQQNHRLEAALAPQIAPGARIEVPVGFALDGHFQRVALPSPDSKLLIITFSPGCPACQANQEGWMKLARALEENGVRVLWVSRDPLETTRDYCIKHGIPFTLTLVDLPHRNFFQLGLARVPNTVLLRADGTVEKVWAGRMDQAGWNSMFAYFGERAEMASSTGTGTPATVPVGAAPSIRQEL